MSKILVGMVVKNNQNQYLITRELKNNMIDYGLIGGLVENENIIQNIQNLLIHQTGVDFSSSLDTTALMAGEDQDGEYIILFCKKDLELTNNSNVEFLWEPFSKIKRLYKSGRLNSNQFEILSKAERASQSVSRNRRAMKVNHSEIKNEKKLNGRGLNFHDDIEENEVKFKRVIERMTKGRKIKPCGKECREYGYLIAKEYNHGSFQNFDELMNDEEFLIEAARISPNPIDCTNYMYFWINNHLKQKSSFKLAFLKSIYLNENVYKLKHIKLIVESLGLEYENKILLADDEFMLEFKKRLEAVDYQTMIEYHCSGLDSEELHDYKVQANNLKVLCDNVIKGLTEILKTFSGYVEEEQKQHEVPTQEEFDIQKILNGASGEQQEQPLTPEQRRAKEEQDFWANFEPREIRRSYN